jgi:hypothetical protein
MMYEGKVRRIRSSAKRQWRYLGKVYAPPRNRAVHAWPGNSLALLRRTTMAPRCATASRCTVSCQENSCVLDGALVRSGRVRPADLQLKLQDLMPLVSIYFQGRGTWSHHVTVPGVGRGLRLGANAAGAPGQHDGAIRSSRIPGDFNEATKKANEAQFARRAAAKAAGDADQAADAASV